MRWFLYVGLVLLGGEKKRGEKYVRPIRSSTQRCHFPSWWSMQMRCAINRSAIQILKKKRTVIYSDHKEVASIMRSHGGGVECEDVMWRRLVRVHLHWVGP